jgi:hypothetical protein
MTVLAHDFGLAAGATGSLRFTLAVEECMLSGRPEGGRRGGNL